eukprot:5425828-Pleurochrysis_carterae.AAC.1
MKRAHVAGKATYSGRAAAGKQAGYHYRICRRLADKYAPESALTIQQLWPLCLENDMLSDE